MNLKICWNFIMLNNFEKRLKQALCHLFTYIFNKDSEIFTNVCVHFTLLGIDMTLTERCHYLYLYKFSEVIGCTDYDCEIKKRFWKR